MWACGSAQNLWFTVKCPLRFDINHVIYVRFKQKSCDVKFKCRIHVLDHINHVIFAQNELSIFCLDVVSLDWKFPAQIMSVTQESKSRDLSVCPIHVIYVQITWFIAQNEARSQRYRSRHESRPREGHNSSLDLRELFAILMYMEMLT